MRISPYFLQQSAARRPAAAAAPYGFSMKSPREDATVVNSMSAGIGLVRDVFAAPSPQSQTPRIKSAYLLLSSVQAASLAATLTCHEKIKLPPVAKPSQLLDRMTDLVPFVLHACKKASVRPRGGAHSVFGGGELEADRLLLDKFNAWLDVTLSGAGTSSSMAAGDGGSSSSISFADLWSTVYSFIRHERGIECDSGNFTIRPLHATYCPSSRAAQSAHAEVLRWLNEMNESPSTSSSGRRGAIATAVDVGCGAGMMTDLLLKGKIPCVVGVDVSENAVQATELLVDSHFEQRRSHRGHRHNMPRFVGLQSPLVPDILFGTGDPSRNVDDGSGILLDHRGAPRALDVNESAARRRRQQSRTFRRDASAGGEADDAAGSLPRPDLVCVHPSMPYLDGWSLLAHPLTYALHQTSQYYHAADVTADLSRSLLRHGPRYVALVAPSLPFSPPGFPAAAEFPVENMLTRDGRYRPVHRRRFGNSPSAAAVLAAEALSAPHVSDLISLLLPKTSSSSLAPPSTLGTLRESVTEWFARSSIETVILEISEAEGRRHFPGHGMTAASSPAAPAVSREDSFERDSYRPTGSSASTPMPDHWSCAGPSYSYLMDEFIDSKGPMEVEGMGGSSPKLPYFSSDEERRRAVTMRQTHEPPAPSSAAAVGKPAHSPLAQFDHNAQEAFSAVFSQEIKARRRGRLRKMALEPQSKRDWYLDEKLVRSHAAQVSLLNELSRLQVPEPD